MIRRAGIAFAAVLALAVAAPGWSRADDWYAEQAPGEYDVSVDLNVQEGVTVESFQAPLAPYGDWVVVGGHGRAWRPRVAPGWRPYYYGRWEWTNEGWFWVSDEPWGWAAYHYGRWAYDPSYGWVWVPGTEWAPAWVAWRYSGDVVGWAPLAPGFSVYVGSYPYVDLWWTFVPCGRFVSVPVYQAAHPPGHGRRWFDATAPAPARPPRGGTWAGGPAPAWGGPAPRHIEARIGRSIAPARIVRAPSPGWRGGRPGDVAVFRPERPARDDGRARPPGDRHTPPRAPGGGHALPPASGGGHAPITSREGGRGEGGIGQRGGSTQRGGWSGAPQGGGQQGGGPQRGGPQRGGPQGGARGGSAHRPEQRHR